MAYEGYGNKRSWKSYIIWYIIIAIIAYILIYFLLLGGTIPGY